MSWWPFGGKKCPKCGQRLVSGHECPVQRRELITPGDRRRTDDDDSSGTVSLVVGAVTGDPLLATLAGGDLPMALVGSALHGNKSASPSSGETIVGGGDGDSAVEVEVNEPSGDSFDFDSPSFDD